MSPDLPGAPAPCPSPQTKALSPGLWAQWQEKPGHTETWNCKRFNLHCLPLRQRMGAANDWIYLAYF